MNIDHHLQVDAALSDASDNLQILFLDTFSSSSLEDRPFEDANKKDYSVGLIQFSEPVIIHELRIVPLSTLVTSDTLKGGRLGATIPSSFEVHFYVNDLKTKNASTFLDIGSLSYKEHERFIFKPTLHVPTDALFLRGLFESLTIAVLGSVTDINRLTTAVPTSKSSGTLHTKDHRGFDSSHTSNSYDEIKSIDEEDGGGGDGRGHNSSLDKSIEIKEPDDLDEDFEEDEDAAALDFSVFPPHRTGLNASSSSSAAAVPSHTHLPPRHSRPESASDTEQQQQPQPHPNNNSENHYHRHYSKNSSKQLNSDSAVPKPSAEEVHSLSPSPVNLRHFARIRSPSSHSHSPSQRSLHSNSSLGVRPRSPPSKSRHRASASASSIASNSPASKDMMRGGGGNRETVRSRTSRDSSSSLPYHYQGGQKGSGGGLPSKYSNTHSLSPSNSNSNSPAPYASSVKGSTLRSTRVGDSPPARYRSDYHHHEQRDYHYRDRDSHHHHHHLPSTSVERDQHHQRREASTASSHHSSSHRDHHHDRYYEYKYHRESGGGGGELSHRSASSSHLQRISPTTATASHSRSYGGRSSGGGGGHQQQQLRSRSPSRESLYGRTAYLRSLGDQPGGTGARSTASGSGGSGDSSSRRSLSRDRRRSQSPFLPSRREVSGSGSSSRDQRGSGGGRGDRDYHLYASDRDRGGRPLSRSPIPPPPPSASTSKHYYASSSSSSVATPSYSLYRSAASSSRRSRSASPVASGGLKRRYRSPPVPYDHHHQQQQGQYSSSSYRGSSPLHLRHRRSRDSSLEAGRHYGVATSGSVVRSPDHKRSRYTLHRMDSPAVQQQQLSPARSSHYKAEGSRHSLRSISPLRRSPPRSPPPSHRSSRGVSKVSSRLSSSSSPRRYHQSKLPSTKQASSSSEHHHRLLSPPYNSSSNNNKSSISPHSSLSNVSLRSLEQDNKVVVIGEGGRGSRSSSAGGKRSVNGATMAGLPPMTTITPSAAGAAELNGTGEVNGLEKVTTTSSKTDDDLFEPLSPSDDLLLLDMPDELSPLPSPPPPPQSADASKSAENYDKISIASDVGLDAVMTTVNDEVALASSESSAKPSIEKPPKTALLEAISSDEDDMDDDPFDDLDDLNTAAAAVLSSENLAKSGSRDGFADVEGSNEFQKKKKDVVVDFVGKEEEEEEEEEEVDSGATAADLDLSSRLFDPFALDQLRPLVFPLNSNPATSFIDERLFAVIVRLVEEKFSALYSSSSSGDEDDDDVHRRRRRGDLINELWVKDVEQLAAEIMKLGSPINVNRGGLPLNTSAATSAEDCPKSTTNNDHQLERLTSTLIAITKDGLDFELAFSAQKQAFKVRHLKAGAKLFTALFSSLELRCPAAQGGGAGGGGLQLSSRLLAANLPHDLLLLYSRPYMTLSLRLLLLNGLAVLADHPEGVAYLCSEKLPWPDVDPAVAGVLSGGSSSENEENMSSEEQQQQQQPLPRLTIYQYVLTLILQPRQNSRLTSVFEELLEKVHLFELCRGLAQIDAGIDDDQQQQQQTLEAMLGQLLASFHRLSDRVHRPLRLLVPTVCQYEVKTAVHASAPLLLLLSSAASASVQTSKTEVQGGDQGGNKTPEQLFSFIRTRLSCRHLACSSSKLALLSTAAFYRYLKHFDLLALLVRLLEQGPHQVQKVVVPLLDAITSHQTGRKFLLEDQRNADLANAAHRCLVSDSENEGDKSITTAFGVKFVTRLHTLNLVDGILQSIYTSQLLLLLPPKESEKEAENSDQEEQASSSNLQLQAIDHLYRLYTMVYLERSVLRETVVGVLTSEHNFDAVLAFLLPAQGSSSATETSSSTTSTTTTTTTTTSFLDSSISFVYASRLAAACIQYLPEGQLVHFYDVYGQLLLRSIESARQESVLKESSATQKEDKTSSAATKLPPPPPKKSSDIYHSHVLQYASLGGWLSPLQSGGTTTTTTTTTGGGGGGGNFSHEELTIRLYVTVLKKAADAVRERLNATENSFISRGLFSAVFQPELITSVKVLAALCDPAADAAKNQAPALQLKYRHSLLHCYSYDLVSYLLTLLEALAETCLRPSHLTLAAATSFQSSSGSADGSSFASLFMKSSSSEAGKQSPELNTSFVLNGGGAAVQEFIRPSVRLLRLILRYLLASVGAGFADATPVPVLLRLYHYLHFYQQQQQQQQQLSVKNSTTAGSSRLQQLMMGGGETVATDIQREIVDLLLSVYTAVFVEHSTRSEEALAKRSVWTKMVRSLLAFTAASPAHFASGLALLCRLLPPPLPAPSSTSKKLTDFELLHLVTYRKLWAAHLHVLKAELEQLVRLLLLADCPLVRRRRLRALCRALCSLHTPTVTGLARSLIEGLVQALNTALAFAWDSSEVGVGGFRQAVVTVSRTLDLTVHLFSASVPFRIALLNGLYLLVNGEAARREPSKIYKLLGKLFKCLYSKRLERFSKSTQPLSSGRLLRNILAEEDRLDGSTATTTDHHDRPPLSRLLVEYFEKNRSLIVVAVTTTTSSEEEGEPSNFPVFRFPEKLASRYTTSTSEALNDYFSRHFQSANQNGSSSSAEGGGGALPMTMIKEENKEVVVKVESGGTLPPLPRNSSEDIVIYSPELAALALSSPLCDDDVEEDGEEDEGEDESSVVQSRKEAQSTKEFRANLVALSQKYFGASKDSSSGGKGSGSSFPLLKTLEVLFSAVVEPSELQAAGHQFTGEGGGGGSGGDHQHSNMMRSGGMHHHHHHHHHHGGMMNHSHGGGGGHLSSGGGGNKQRLLMRSGGGRNHHSSRNFGGGGGGGGGGVRNHHDPFRSRPPNTSRPPSMHVDDFVALEQRQDTSGGGSSMKNNARSSGGGLNNSSSVSASSSSYQGGGGGGKDYHMLRKKNPPSSHLSSSSTSSPHHSQHHHPHHLSMGRAGGNSSSAASGGSTSQAHYSKQ